MLLTAGLFFGLVVSILCSYEPLLSPLGLLISSLLPAELGLGFIIAYLSISSVTKYITSVISNDPILEGTTKSGKVNALKALDLAKKSAISHYAASNFSLLVTAFAIPLISINMGLLPGAIVLPLSVFILGGIWCLYLFRDKSSILKKMIVVGALGLLAYGSITTQGSRGTIILFSCLFSLNAAISSLNKKENKIPTTNLKQIGDVKGVPVIMHSFVGLLSSVMIGFPSSSADKVVSRKQGKLSVDKKGKLNITKTSNNAVHETIGNSISSGFQSGIGISLFLLDGVSRDSASTILGSLFMDITLSSIEVVAIITIFIAVSTAALFFFDELAKGYIQYFNFKIDSGLDHTAKLLTLVIIVTFTIMASLGNLLALAAIVIGCYGVNTFITKNKLDRELVGIITLILPGLALTGII